MLWSEGRVALAALPALAFYATVTTVKAQFGQKGGCNMPPRKSRNRSQPRLDGVEWGPPRVYERLGVFEAVPPPDEATKVLRGVLADALERSFTDGPLAVVLLQTDEFPEHALRFVRELSTRARANDHEGALELLRAWMLRVFQDVAVALFPEIYAGDPRAVGLVPEGGPERVGKKRLDATAAAGRLLAAVRSV